MKKKSLITLVCSFICILSSSFTLIGCSEKSTKGLDYFPLSNNTYAVEVGEAKYVEEIIIPAKHKGKAVTMIGANAFSGCQSLRKITLPETINKIENNAFYSCPQLEYIQIDEANKYYSSQDGILYNKGKTEFFIIPKGVIDVTIPDEILDIGTYFANCNKLKEITISKQVTSLVENAFYGCQSLRKVILDKNISHLPQGLFDSCINLTAIEVDDENNYYSSQDGILYNKKKTQILHAPKKITEATLPNTLTAIQDHSFLNCTALTTILIPKSITSIGFQAFCNCIKLKNVYYTGSKQEWETIYIDMLNSELNNATIYYDYYDI